MTMNLAPERAIRDPAQLVGANVPLVVEFTSSRVRQRPLAARAGGIEVATGRLPVRAVDIDASPDLRRRFKIALLPGPPNGASLLGTRHTPGYLAALGAVIDYARSRVNAPVWLIGTSQGSTGAANGAAHLTPKVAGVVLTSSVTRIGRADETVFDADPGTIAVPALVVSNSGDPCRVSPPGDGQRLLAALTRSPRKELILVQSSQFQSDPCEALSPHGYLGIEAMVVQRIADWIKTAPGR